MNIPILTTGYYDLEKYEPIGLITPTEKKNETKQRNQ
jgi:hypothetical protein